MSNAQEETLRALREAVDEVVRAEGETPDHALTIGGMSATEGMSMLTVVKDTSGNVYLRTLPPQYGAPVAITPDDATDLTNGAAWGFIATVTGTVKFNTARASGVTITATAGAQYMFPVTRIFATGTTATGIVALYP